MSIADTINSIKTNLSSAYDKLVEKQATIPAEKNLENLAGAIGSVPAGGGEEINFTTHPDAYAAVRGFQDDLSITVTYLGEEAAASMLAVTYDFTQLGFVQMIEVAFSALAATIDTTSIGDNFLSKMTPNNYNSAPTGFLYVSGLENLTQITSIGQYFLGQPDWGMGGGGASNFALKSFTGFPPNVQSLGRYCFYNQTLLDCPIVFPESLTVLSTQGVLYGCSSFNSPITLPSQATSLGSQFMQGCASFNQPLTLPSTLTTISSQFMSGCSAFNYPLIIPDTVTVIGDYFLNAASFNQTLVIPATVTQIGSGFLSYARAFNRPIVLPEGLTSVPHNFLSGTTSFNSSITLPSTIASIGASFLADSGFNQPLAIPEGVTSIGDNFLQRAKNFNSALTLPSTLATIGAYFLNQAYAFDQPLIIPDSVVTIGSNFLAGDQYSTTGEVMAFNQPLTIPSSVTSISDHFMSMANSYTSVLTVDCAPGAASDYNGVLVVRTNSVSATEGIPVAGAYAEQWLSTYPNGATYGGVRNLRLAEI